MLFNCTISFSQRHWKRLRRGDRLMLAMKMRTTRMIPSGIDLNPTPSPSAPPLASQSQYLFRSPFNFPLKTMWLFLVNIPIVDRSIFHFPCQLAILAWWLVVQACIYTLDCPLTTLVGQKLFFCVRALSVWSYSDRNAYILLTVVLAYFPF